MDLSNIPDKSLHELERLAGELLVALKHAKLSDAPITEVLRDFQLQTGAERRVRYDASEGQYSHY
jgi:hypothetical protein